MRLASTRPQNQFMVDWWLMNHCQYQCSYCADILRSGSIDPPDWRDCQRAVSVIHGHCSALDLTAHYHLTGGEVTEWPWLIDLLREIKSLGGRTRIRTNASMAVDQWRAVVENLDTVNLEYHPEFANPAHFLMILSATRSQGVSASVTVNMMQQRWAELEDLIAKITQLWPDQGIFRRMLFTDPVVNRTADAYTAQQIVKLKRQTGPLALTLSDGTVEYTDYQTLVLENQHQFRDWWCYSGVEQIVIDAHGRVFRGHCRQGGKLGTIAEGFTVAKDPQQCCSMSCRNSFDIDSTKSRVLD